MQRFWQEHVLIERGGSNIVLLTRLGGGTFGNDNKWIEQAIARALDAVSGLDLDEA